MTPNPHTDPLHVDNLFDALCERDLSGLEIARLAEQGAGAVADFIGCTVAELTQNVVDEIEDADAICAATIELGPARVRHELARARIVHRDEHAFTVALCSHFEALAAMEAVSPARAAWLELARRVAAGDTASRRNIAILERSADRLGVVHVTPGDLVQALDSVHPDGLELRRAVSRLGRRAVWFELPENLDARRATEHLLELLETQAARESGERLRALDTVIEALDAGRYGEVAGATYLVFRTWEFDYTVSWLATHGYRVTQAGIIRDER